MTQEPGRCPGCDQEGEIGESCPEKGCAKRGYHFIPSVDWERAHPEDGSPPDPVIGQVIGDYLIVDRIGAGGFGRVYLSLQRPLYRLRGALKLLELPSENEALIEALFEKFQGEAEALAQLTHPNIVRLLKYGMKGTRPYLVMESVDNAETLRREIFLRARRKEGFTHEQLRTIFEQLLNGLEAAHEQDIIHRDMKPENIMLQRVVGNPLHVRILDFGTAKFIANQADTKWPLGSPSYMAPEQVNLKGIGPWSDLYAIGVMIFELLTGYRPFPGSTEVEIVAYKMNPDFDPIRRLEELDFPEEVVEFVRKALARDPEDRYRSAAEFRVAMGAAFDELKERPGVYGTGGAELSELLNTGVLQDLSEQDNKPTRAGTPPLYLESPDPKPVPDSKEKAEEPSAKVEDIQQSSSGDNGHKKNTSVAPILLLSLAVLGGIGAAIAYFSPFAEPKAEPKDPPMAIAKAPDVGPIVLPTQDAGTPTDAGKDLGKDSGGLEFDEADILTSSPAVSVSAGKFHTCAVVYGEVRCWGASFEGALGHGREEAIGDDETASKAHIIKFSEPVTMVSAAGDRQSNYSCALLESGKVQCWGDNTFGQLGLGHTDTIGDDELPGSVPPVDLGGPAKFISVGSSQFASHACAIMLTGEVRCWGGNKYGELGLAHTTKIGDDEAPSSVPPVDLREPAIHVSSGKYSTCVVLESGNVRCWGWNKYGQLGLGHTNDIGDDEAPGKTKRVNLGKAKATKVSVGRWHACALIDDGTARCWGRNNKGQLGLGNTDDIGDDETPRKLKPIALSGKVTDIVAGSLHSCALIEGKVRCWGDNKFGQLGYSHTRAVGDDELVDTVAEVYLGEKAKSISAGSYHNCVVTESDQVRCWGYNKFGQLGYGHTKNIGDTETPAGAGDVPLKRKKQDPK